MPLGLVGVVAGLGNRGRVVEHAFATGRTVLEGVKDRGRTYLEAIDLSRRAIEQSDEMFGEPTPATVAGNALIEEARRRMAGEEPSPESTPEPDTTPEPEPTE